ncbi:MAG: cytochrome c biogenesis protein CcsA [Candidatus Nitrotoga sp.]|jgi:ABC-type uncharacterized transport system permease subunit|nr:cytochrome c biogenesis protein CcsA [Candidatus Nitrotoga sp.]MBP0118951.1 cytochrome c biogenesis protein CcsA [Candidatus Nitrotoga sp.]
MSNPLIYVITFLAYSSLAIYFWRAQSAGNVETLNRGMIGHALLVPLSLHAYLLGGNLFGGGSLNLGLVNALSLILWLTMAVYWVARFFYSIASLQTLVLPLAAVGALLPALFPTAHPATNNLPLLLEAHIFVAMLAYSLFITAVLHASLMSLVEKHLHRAAPLQVLKNLPPLLTMEILLFRIIGSGFILLTLTLASGIIFSDQLFGRPLQFNHKILFGFISWFVFLVLLLGHYYKGWRGRTAVRWTVSGFVFLLLAYLGTQFVLEVLLHR